MKKPILSSYIAIIMAAILYGFQIYGVKVLGMSGFSLVEVLIMPSAAVALLLFWFAKGDIKKFYSFPLWLMILYPINQIVLWISQFAPLYLGLSVSMVVLLLYTQPLWTCIFNVLFFKARLTRDKIILLATIMTGLVVLVAPWKEFSFSIFGFILALFSGIAFSIWILLNSNFFIKGGMKPISMSFFSNLYACVPFILALPLFTKIFPETYISSFTLDRPLDVMLWVVIFAVFAFIMPQFLFYTAAKKINSIYLGFILLIEPVVAVSLDIVFLGTQLKGHIFIGGALIIAANAYLVISENRKPAAEKA
ncbi:MAG: DMT family transporter [Lactobacillales bacterium]|jgi:drug/metabolite transporter (DMT)-like permease|nr:DMT family transporter [Lactobacillales bacterium]